MFVLQSWEPALLIGQAVITVSDLMAAKNISRILKRNFFQLQDSIRKIRILRGSTFYFCCSGKFHFRRKSKFYLFSNHSAVKREQIIFILNIIRRRQESGLGISFIDSYHGNTWAVKLQKYEGHSQETVKLNTDHTMKSNHNNFANHNTVKK